MERIIDYEQKCREELESLGILDHSISNLQNEISRLKQDNKTSNKETVVKPVNTSVSIEEKEDDTFEDEINFFLTSYRQLKENFTEDEMKSILPRRKHPRYKDILYRLSIESIKEIKDLKDILREEEISEDDELLCRNLIDTEKRKIDCIKSRLISSVIESEEEIEEKNKLVLVPTSNGNTRVVDELEHIPSDYYDGFRELIQSIEDGTFKNVKVFKNNNNLIGISEVKAFKIRVVFTRLSSDTYALITAFVKKCDNDKLYNESLVNKVRDYYSKENMLKEAIKDPVFMEENEKNLKQLWNIISPQVETKCKKKGRCNMTIEELDRQIEIRKEELDDEVKYEAYRYLKGFLKYYKSENLLDFLDMDMAAFIDCSLYLDCKNKDIPKFHEIAEITRDLYEKQNDKLLDKIISTTTFFYNEGKIDELIKYYKTEGFINDIKQLNSMSDNSYTVLSLPSIKKSLDGLDMDIIPLLELIKEEGQPVLDLLNFALVHSEVLRFCSGRVFALYTNVTNPKQLEDKKAAVLARELEDFFDVEDILRRMKTIRTFVEEYERVDRNNQKEINELDDSRSKLERDLDKKQIVRYREITKGIRSAKIKYSFLKYIREHNEEYYDELLSEYNKLKQDSKVSIQALLNDYGIPKDSYDYDNLPNYGRDELESILKVLSRLTITNEEKISILQNTTPEKVATLKNYLDREIIPISYVSEHIELFNEDSKELDNLKENIKVLKEHNVQLSVFTNSIDILMGEPESINNNIGILESYNLLNGLNSREDLSFIQRNGLDEVIDKYLELGFEEYLENDLNLLNKKALERIELLQVVGIPINSKEELESFLSDDKEFFVPLKEIDNYLPNEVDYVEEPEEQITIDMLDKYKATDRVYDFDGIKISIQKVNKSLDEGNSLYQSIIKNTHLNEEQLTKISKIVSVKHVKELKIG